MLELQDVPAVSVKTTGLPVRRLKGLNITLPVANHCAGKKREFRFHPIKEAVMEEPADITPWLDQLDDTMKEKVLQLQKSR